MAYYTRLFFILKVDMGSGQYVQWLEWAQAPKRLGLHSWSRALPGLQVPSRFWSGYVQGATNQWVSLTEESKKKTTGYLY